MLQKKFYLEKEKMIEDKTVEGRLKGQEGRQESKKERYKARESLRS
jgi:hypothetical protein